MKYLVKVLPVLIMITALFSSLAGTEAFAQAKIRDPEGIERLKRLPIQDAGRIKPLNTFALETLQLVYGRTSYRPLPKPGVDGEQTDQRARPALEIIMTWFLAPQFWDDQPIVEMKMPALKEALNLDKSRDRFSPQELFTNDRIGLVLQELAAYRETKAKLNPYYQSVARLENQLGVYQAVKDASLLRLVPPASASAASADANAPKEPERWRSVRDLDGDLKAKFGDIAKAFVRALPGAEAVPDEAGAPKLSAAVEAFETAARAENPTLYPDGKNIGIEVHYEELHPFRLAWVFYVLSAIFMGIAWNRSGKPHAKNLTRAGWALALIAFAIHSYGFGLRMYLTGRPPVSNMYESVIWVSWGTMLFAFFFEWKQKAHFVLIAGAIVATLCNIIADSVPHVLDGSLQPLEPVLRSNLWLTVHVLTISISYSAYFLAWALGNFGLVFVAKGDSASSPRVEALTVAIYRCIQVGVVLLAAGTILGGVWADYSWGRFWGWDPKETWALIALLGYLALLHARLSGLVKNIGMLVGAVVAFNLVMMAWYGVNFVLGAGLHSYGFGAGGVEYVSGFVLLNLAFAGYAYAVNRARLAVAA